MYDLNLRIAARGLQNWTLRCEGEWRALLQQWYQRRSSVWLCRVSVQPSHCRSVLPSAHVTSLTRAERATRVAWDILCGQHSIDTRAGDTRWDLWVTARPDPRGHVLQSRPVPCCAWGPASNSPRASIPVLAEVLGPRTAASSCAPDLTPPALVLRGAVLVAHWL